MTRFVPIRRHSFPSFAVVLAASSAMIALPVAAQFKGPVSRMGQSWWPTAQRG